MDSLPENSKGDLGKNTEQAMPDKKQTVLRAIIIFLSYALMAVVMTWPMVAKISSPNAGMH